MSIKQLSSIDDLRTFIKGSPKVSCAILGSKQEKYEWVQTTLIQFRYMRLNKADKGIVRQHMEKITGYSRQQLTRLIANYKTSGCILYKPRAMKGFKIKYTRKDILALVAIDELHGTLNGHATKKLCERAWQIYHDPAYENLAHISVAHLYNLRASHVYKNQRIVLEKTKPAKSTIGVRRKPEPNGSPGYLRVDTVHQGDYDKQKGVYHINAVDEVTQFEIVCTVEKISEQYLKPVLEYILDAFPFAILGFHSDNGSEYVNKVVAELLNKLFVEFTKSRPRKSNDNALAESKNGSIIRKTFGYAHIPQFYARIVNVFNKTHLNYYLNYHRPCLFPSTAINSKGKVIKKYHYTNVMTPYEKLKSLPSAESFLKKGVTFEELEPVCKLIY